VEAVLFMEPESQMYFVLFLLPLVSCFLVP